MIVTVSTAAILMIWYYSIGVRRPASIGIWFSRWNSLVETAARDIVDVDVTLQTEYRTNSAIVTILLTMSNIELLPGWAENKGWGCREGEVRRMSSLSNSMSEKQMNRWGESARLVIAIGSILALLSSKQSKLAIPNWNQVYRFMPLLSLLQYTYSRMLVVLESKVKKQSHVTYSSTVSLKRENGGMLALLHLRRGSPIKALLPAFPGSVLGLLKHEAGQSFSVF